MQFCRKFLTLVVLPTVLTVLTFYLQLGLHTNVVLQVYPVFMSHWTWIKSFFGFQVYETSSKLGSKPVRKICCSKIFVEGTKLSDPWYAGMMGEYSIFEGLQDATSFPVYKHEFNLKPPELTQAPSSYLYFYKAGTNQQQRFDECGSKGCWIISK